MQVRTLCTELPDRVGQQVYLKGWVHRIRDFGGVRFLVLRDRTGQGQVVLSNETDLGDINCEWVVAITGTCRREPRAPGGVEVRATGIEVLAAAQPPPLEVFNPKSARKNRLETLLDNRAISLRLADVQEVFHLQAEVLRAFRSYLRGQGFVEIVTPKLVLAGAEGGSAVFEVAYFDRTAYLAQSPQFYKQIMVGSGLERVFEVGHAYRAEKSETSRHLTEYLSLDFEMGFIESEQDVMRMHTGVIGAIFEAVRMRCGETLDRLAVTLPQVDEIPQIDFRQAKRILSEKFGKTDGLEGDLDTEGEKLVCQWAKDELGSELLYVTGYHADKRPMYTMPHEDAPPLTRSFDLLFRGVEITTGSQRIHNYDQLVDSMRQRGLCPDDFESYLATFKHGMCPHGGVGMGIERLIKQMLGPIDRQASQRLPPRPLSPVTIGRGRRQDIAASPKGLPTTARATPWAFESQPFRLVKRSWALTTVPCALQAPVRRYPFTAERTAEHPQPGTSRRGSDERPSVIKSRLLDGWFTSA